MQPPLLVERILVAGLQPFGRLAQGGADLPLGGERVDRDAQVAHRPFGLGVAAGKGKADTARTGGLPGDSANSSALQYGDKRFAIKRLARQGGFDEAVADRSEGAVGDVEV